VYKFVASSTLAWEMAPHREVSPFDTYFAPWLILFSVLGLGRLMAATLAWSHHPLAPHAPSAGGAALLACRRKA